MSAKRIKLILVALMVAALPLTTCQSRGSEEQNQSVAGIEIRYCNS